MARVMLKLRTIEVPARAEVGPGLHLAHGAPGLVLHETTHVGAEVRIFQGVTVGRSDSWMDDRYIRPPGGGVTIEDGAFIGAGAKILFNSGQRLTIGAGAVIGANAVVTSDVAPGEIWAGNPARRVGHRDDRLAS